MIRGETVFRGVSGRWAVGGSILLAGLAFVILSPSGPSHRAAAEGPRVVVLPESELLGIRIATPSKRSFAPEQVVGPPDVKQAGDNGLAWASQTTDGQREWLLCEFDEPRVIRAVMVYETYNPGALVRVTAFNAAGEEIPVWEGEDPTPKGTPKGISVIPVKPDFPTQKIRLSIDSPAVPGWNEIDAVSVEDAQGNLHWTSKAQASSSFGAPSGPSGTTENKRAYSPEQACGEPDTPRPGDQASAWASATTDAQPEWLVCEFKTAQRPAEIIVHENNAPGAITKVTVFNPQEKDSEEGDGEEIVVWEGIDPTPRDQPWGISVFPIKVDFEFRKLKLYINSPDVPGYNEVDAVGLRAINGDVQWASAAQASTTFGVPTGGALGYDSGMMMGPGMPANTNVPAIQRELQALRRQVDELQQLRKELKEIKELLKDKSK